MLQKNIKKHTRPCYYLVYKILTQSTMWIVKVDDNKYDFFDHIKNFSSKIERYYIIKKYVSNIEDELKTKRFTVFNKTNDCYVLAQTN